MGRKGSTWPYMSLIVRHIACLVYLFLDRYNLSLFNKKENSLHQRLRIPQSQHQSKATPSPAPHRDSVITMSVQDKAQHAISQIDKGVSDELDLCGLVLSQLMPSSTAIQVPSPQWLWTSNVHPKGLCISRPRSSIYLPSIFQHCRIISYQLRWLSYPRILLSACAVY